ncbi:hypothetical protein Aduo_006365 [Ancylostoma duodenale]
MDPQLPSHNGVFSLILQRMMLEAHAANGAILSNYGHVYPAGKDISMPLLPLSRNDSRAGNVSPSLQFWRKDSSSAHKRQNLEMKISLLKKRKELEVESQVKDSPLIKSNESVELVKGEAVPDEGRDPEDGEASGESSDAKKECIIDLADSADSELDVGTEQVFKSPHAADVHFKKTHKKPAPPTDCEECGKRFASAFQLREHISIQHLKERNFVCEECGQKFGRRGGLRRHVQMVHQNHLHMCPYEGCDHPGYKCSKALTAHIRSVHTNIRPYVCETCQKAFVRRNDLKMHTLTHTSETSFHCECGSKFRRLIYLKKHQRLCTPRNNVTKSAKKEPLDDCNEKDEEDVDDQNL